MLLVFALRLWACILTHSIYNSCILARFIKCLKEEQVCELFFFPYKIFISCQRKKLRNSWKSQKQSRKCGRSYLTLFINGTNFFFTQMIFKQAYWFLERHRYRITNNEKYIKSWFFLDKPALFDSSCRNAVGY